MHSNGRWNGVHQKKRRESFSFLMQISRINFTCFCIILSILKALLGGVFRELNRKLYLILSILFVRVYTGVLSLHIIQWYLKNAKSLRFIIETKRNCIFLMHHSSTFKFSLADFFARKTTVCSFYVLEKVEYVRHWELYMWCCDLYWKFYSTVFSPLLCKVLHGA